MRRRLLVLALLGTTALTPTRVDAAVVVGWVAGALGVAGGTALGTTAAYAAGSAFAATALGGFVVRTVVGVGLSVLSRALESQQAVRPPSARMVNFAQPINYVEWVFGRTRKGGPLGFTGFTDNRRYYVPILAAHPIEGFVEHWFDERVVTLNAEGDQSIGNVATAPMAGYGRVNTFTGGEAQVVDPGLAAAFSQITSAHDFAGLSGAVIWAKRPAQSKFSDVYKRGREWAYAPVFDGNNQIYDPRDESTKYSNNAALVLAYWFTEILGQQVDWDDVAIEADASDVEVTNAQAETQPMWTLNGSINDGQEFEEQRAMLAVACDAFVYERADGKVGFKVGRWIEPTITLTDADFYECEAVHGQWGADAPTAVAVNYTEPENGWRETPSGLWVEDDEARLKKHEPELYLITNHNQAQRVNRRLARIKRPRVRVNGRIGLIGHEMIGHRFVRVEHAALSVASYFEVGELERVGQGMFSVQLDSVEPADFDPALTEPARPQFGTVTSSDDIPDVTGLGATAQDGGSLKFSFDAVDEAYTQQIRIQKSGETDWQVITVPEGQETLQVPGLVDGETYKAQARNRTSALRPGAWKPETPYEAVVVADSTAPAALIGFSADLNGASADITFTAPNDEHYFATCIYRATGSSDFADAAEIRTEYGIPSNADSWTDAAPGVGTHYYWAEPINGSGVPGPRSGPDSVTVT